MFPSLRQRALITIAVLIGGFVCYQAGAFAAPLDGSGGRFLLFAPSWPVALGAFVIALLIVSILAALPAAAGNPLAGPFVLATCIGVAAVFGGSIDDWLRSQPADSTGPGYWGFAAESLIWAALLLAGIALTQAMRRRAAPLIPAILKPHEDDEESPPPWMFGSLIRGARLGKTGSSDRPLVRLRPLGGPVVQVLLSMLISAAIGGVAVILFMQSSDVRQVMCVLIGAFVVGGVASHQIVQTRIAIGVLLSPLLIAIIGYGWMAFRFGADGDVLRGVIFAMSADSGPSFLNLALAAPIHYASAGVMGAAMGLGWSQVMLEARITDAPAKSSSAPATDG